ncbi:MAG: ProQ/FINO family protein [Janthinobacterium lividum]
MKPNPQAPSTPQPARVLLKQLQDQFAVFRDCLPLAIGIDKQLLTRLPEINRKVLRVALGIHTNSLRYLKVMEKARLRRDLDGNEAGEVPDSHRVYASKVLRERSAKNAERRAEQQKAEEAARAAAMEEQAASQRAEKLSQLAEKFSRG